MGLANRLGASVLPFMNPRVVAPPGVAGRHGRPNIVVATPMRSGTHVLIDLLLNNLSDYRTRPLYVDLDQCVKQSAPGRDLVASVASDAGHVVKTHQPLALGVEPSDPAEVERIFDDAGVVLTVRRDTATVLRSLAQWDRSQAQLDAHAAALDGFWEFWSARRTLDLTFEDLFDPARMAAVLDQVAESTATTRRARLRMPPPQRRATIYTNKTLTRLLGRGAPRVDTTIHTFK